MNAPALPAYLQNRQSQGVAARATAGMGGIFPPHISIAGNCFTLIDAAGNKMPLGGTMQACVVDICDHMNKRYYENDWTPGSDEPPTCFSRNGVGPSRESQKPQSSTCATCQWNVRGSDTSKLSGKSIKACRDEKDLAVLLPQYPNMLFQMTIPPGSFKNWSGFTAAFKSGGPDVSDVLVSFGFQPQANGVMTFQATAYIDEATFAARETAIAQKATDVLVGRTDVPIAQKATDVLVGRTDVPIALPAPPVNLGGQHSVAQQPSQTVATTSQPQLGAPGQPAQFGGQPAAQGPFVTGAAVSNAGAFGQPAQQPASSAETKYPSEQPKTRTRRTREQIAADNAAKAAAQAGGSPSHAPQGGQQPQAPFPVNSTGAAAFGAAPAAPQGFGGQPAATQFGAGQAQAATSGQQTTAAAFTGQAPAGNGQSFGIQQGADPNVDPALAEMLRTLGQ